MHKKKTSPWSATMIGVHDGSSDGDIAKRIFIEESKEINSLTRGIHHSRKIGHQQVNYPETVNKLSAIISKNDQLLQPNNSNFSVDLLKSCTSTLDNKQKAYEFKNITLKHYQDAMNENIQNEHHLNLRKRAFQRELGRKSIVNEILSGTAPAQQDVLFPQRASHEQILAITGNLKSSNPHLIPPEIPITKRWKGDNEGWGT